MLINKKGITMKYLLSIFLTFSLLLGGGNKLYTVDASQSTVKWIGNKVTGTHWGNVDIFAGTITLHHKTIVSGTIVIDMTSITNGDMDVESQWNAKLVNHLKSEDFFDVTNHKTATFKITKSTMDKGTYLIQGDLTIKGITQPIEFPATINFSNGNPTATGQIKIDRTKFDITYKSGTIFPDLGDNFIYDDFIIEFLVKIK